MHNIKQLNENLERIKMMCEKIGLSAEVLELEKVQKCEISTGVIYDLKNETLDKLVHCIFDNTFTNLMVVVRDSYKENILDLDTGDTLHIDSLFEVVDKRVVYDDGVNFDWMDKIKFIEVDENNTISKII